ncbi:hypothetical protein ANN_13732 [Periplaneta americana]|uniref:Transposase IS204/IS1001/IS1096/IS1165 DDE domain-containing protein n=1 Tax=Periplaneta americana TaxID=6978 RepID=A0ABQ8SVC1_PERAM|nr:hypothetical protein ANN_13732 [Periplaneta americana]
MKYEDIGLDSAVVAERSQQSVPLASRESAHCDYLELEVIDLQCDIRLKIVHQLSDHDCVVRKTFSEHFIELVTQQPDLIRRMIMCDEAHFQLCGNVNKQNMRYWSNVNLRVSSETSRHSKGKNHKVFATRPDDLDTLKQRIRNEIHAISSHAYMRHGKRCFTAAIYIYALNIAMRQLRMICDAAVNKKPARTSFQADRFLLCNPPRKFSIPF